MSLMQDLVKHLPYFSLSRKESLLCFNKLQLEDFGLFLPLHSSARFCSPFPSCGVSLKCAVQNNLFLGNQIWCSNIFRSRDVEFSLFILPPKSTLPLHDHPTMEAYQRIIYGELEVSEITVPPSYPSLPSKGVITFNGRIGVQNQSDTALELELQPKTCMLHELSNDSDNHVAIFINILTPPYGDLPQSLDCTYFWASKTALCNPKHSKDRISSLFQVEDDVFLFPRTNCSPLMSSLIFV